MPTEEWKVELFGTEFTDFDEMETILLGRLTVSNALEIFSELPPDLAHHYFRTLRGGPEYGAARLELASRAPRAAMDAFNWLNGHVIDLLEEISRRDVSGRWSNNGPWYELDIMILMAYALDSTPKEEVLSKAPERLRDRFP